MGSKRLKRKERKRKVFKLIRVDLDTYYILKNKTREKNKSIGKVISEMVNKNISKRGRKK